MLIFSEDVGQAGSKVAQEAGFVHIKSFENGVGRGQTDFTEEVRYADRQIQRPRLELRYLAQAVLLAQRHFGRVSLQLGGPGKILEGFKVAVIIGRAGGEGQGWR